MQKQQSLKISVYWGSDQRDPVPPGFSRANRTGGAEHTDLIETEGYPGPTSTPVHQTHPNSEEHVTSVGPLNKENCWQQGSLISSLVHDANFVCFCAKKKMRSVIPAKKVKLLIDSFVPKLFQLIPHTVWMCPKKSQTSLVDSQLNRFVSGIFQQTLI